MSSNGVMFSLIVSQVRSYWESKTSTLPPFWMILELVENNGSFNYLVAGSRISSMNGMVLVQPVTSSNKDMHLTDMG